MLGDQAPLDEFADVKRRHGVELLVDEAHSLGVFGDHGRGIAEAYGVEKDVDYVVGTFSKSLVAVGVAPLLLSVLPCAAMCALGLCMNRMAGKSCSTGKVAADAAAPAEHSPSQALPATVRNVERLRPSHDEPVRPEEYAAGGKAADFVEAPTSDKRR